MGLVCCCVGQRASSSRSDLPDEGAACRFRIQAAYGCQRKPQRREPRSEGALLAVVVAVVAELAQLARVVARLQIGARVQQRRDKGACWSGGGGGANV